MSESTSDDGFFATIVFGGIGALLGLALMVIGAAMVLPLYLLKKPLSQALNLQSLSSSWPMIKWIGVPILFISGLVFIQSTIAATQDFSSQPMTFAHTMSGLANIAQCVFFALLFDIFYWLKGYFEDGDLQKSLAGKRAERHVQQLIAGNQLRFPLSRSLHGTLFVFNNGSVDEFSLEADHILVTQRNIFVIETKYKSGTISAGADVSNWTVSTRDGDKTMRNALKQAKNAARVLGRQFDLPCDVIPLVAIKGNDVKIIDGPSNVVAVEDLLKIIDAFESAHKDTVVNPQAVLALLAKYASTDQAAMERHIQRAELARIKAGKADIVSAASLR